MLKRSTSKHFEVKRTFKKGGERGPNGLSCPFGNESPPFKNSLEVQNGDVEISKESLEEFKKLYKEEFGKDLTDGEALEIAQRLLGFCLIVCRPLPKENEPEEENPDIDF